jgi:hypothetical protein
MTSDDWEAAQRRAELRVALTPGAADLLVRTIDEGPVSIADLDGATDIAAVSALSAAQLVSVADGRLQPSHWGVRFAREYPELIDRLLGAV